MASCRQSIIICGISECIFNSKALPRIGTGNREFSLLDPSEQLVTGGDNGPGISAPGPKSYAPPKESQRVRGTSRHLTFTSLLIVTDGINIILATSLGLHLPLAD